MFHIQRGHRCFYSGKKEVSAEGFADPAIRFSNRKTDRRNASFAGFRVCDRAWHVAFRPCQKRSGYERCDPPAP